MSQVILRCYYFPARLPGHLFASLPGPTLISSVRVRSLRLRSWKVGGAFRARINVQPATRLPVCSHVDVCGISQVSRRSVLCLCLGPGPRPNRRSLAYLRFRRCCPHSYDREGFSVLTISGLSRGFSTCCLRFKNGVATTHAKLASGWLARLYREGVEPSDHYKRFQITLSSPSSGLILAQRTWIFKQNRKRPVLLAILRRTQIVWKNQVEMECGILVGTLTSGELLCLRCCFRQWRRDIGRVARRRCNSESGALKNTESDEKATPASSDFAMPLYV